MSFSSVQLTAIFDYAKRSNVRPTLSVYPDAYFIDNAGVTIKRNIHTLMSELDSNKKYDKREKQRAKREEDRAASIKRRFS